jgi:hypothetical protein
MCGKDVSDGRVMMLHLVEKPSHRQILVQNDAQLFVFVITAVFPETQEINFRMHKVNIKVRSGA